jgi:uncharacterized protein YbbC (DUF1343 family)
MKRFPALLVGAAIAVTAQTYPGSADIDRAVEAAIAEKLIPGAVAIVGQKGSIVHRKAYGKRALVPAPEPMTLDTVFDAASLTKVVATTSAIMKLFEQGKIRLNDPVTAYLPNFQGGKSAITVRHLLTHFSGLRPDVDLEPVWSGYETGIGKALADKPVALPGERFIYSDINYLLLGEMVRVLSGETLADYARHNIFEPLGMKDTRFQPPAGWRARIAPTEWHQGDAGPLRGAVHDETTRFMGGIAGHAGMFTTAGDLSRFAQMMLGRGALDGKRHFAEATIAKFTSPQTPPGQATLRGFGWDIDSRYSANRGELFPIGSYGHTGFTGTSLWIDPSTQSYVILLANSVHPKRGINISSLRSRVATVAAAHAGIASAGVMLTGYNEAAAGAYQAVARNAAVKTGLDVLAAENFASLAGKRVGLITNHTGIDRLGRRNIDVMAAAGVNLVALFSPEHGIAGNQDHETVGHGRDEKTGVPVWSLYLDGQRKPNSEMLSKVDTLVFDIQDVGVRFYTYMCTMLNAMEAASAHKIRFVVLDRPNPITGARVEGPMLDDPLQSFVGCASLPLRHGMTLGEIAAMENSRRKWNVDLQVIKMQGWQRGDWFDSTMLPWVDPSPNIRSLVAATVYPGVAMLEYSADYSVGRGTEAPFEHFGAEWIRGPELAGYLNSRQIPGVRFYPVRFKPSSSKLEGKWAEGLRVMLTDRNSFDGSRLGLEIAGALLKLYPGKMKLDVNAKLIGNEEVMRRLASGEDPRAIHESLSAGVAEFDTVRRRFLLY